MTRLVTVSPALEALSQKRQRLRLNCPACQKYAQEGETFHPPHDPSPMCESGKRPHCTCERCFDEGASALVADKGW